MSQTKQEKNKVLVLEAFDICRSHSLGRKTSAFVRTITYRHREPLRYTQSDAIPDVSNNSRRYSGDVHCVPARRSVR
jgi:hypothetical protein